MIYKFESKTCGPCKKVQKMLDSLGIQVKHIDVQENLDEARKYNITMLPTLINGNKRLSGVPTLEQLKEFCFEEL